MDTAATLRAAGAEPVVADALDAGQLAAGLTAVTAAVVLTQLVPVGGSPASSTATDQPGNRRNITMRDRHHISRRGVRRHGAVLVGAILTLITRRGRHHPRHQPDLGSHPLAGSRFGQSRHQTRRGHRRARWSR